MQTNDKKLFMIGKATAIASATISTYEAATKAFAKVPYPANIAAAASITVAGLVNVNKIRKTTIPRKPTPEYHTFRVLACEIVFLMS